MKLYFVRHATASDIATSDSARELTREGYEEAHVAGKALVRLGARPSRIFCSPLVRARQTAEVLGVELGARVETLDELRNDTSSSRLFKAIKSTGETKEVLLVGHMPSLSEHVAHLIGAGIGTGLGFGKASVALVESSELKASSGELRWFMRQKQLRELLS